MKLIIDIDEEYYDFVKDYNDVTLSKINRVLYESVSNGIPLEDIKAEIRQKQWHIGVDSANQVIEIIDKHIKENKQ